MFCLFLSQISRSVLAVVFFTFSSPDSLRKQVPRDSHFLEVQSKAQQLESVEKQIQIQFDYSTYSSSMGGEGLPEAMERPQPGICKRAPVLQRLCLNNYLRLTG